VGYGTRQGSLGHTIKTFWPDDTDTTMYIDASYTHTLADIQQKIEEKWPGTPANCIEITTDEINTDCLGYDLYDPSDYTMFLIIRKVSEG